MDILNNIIVSYICVSSECDISVDLLSFQLPTQCDTCRGNPAFEVEWIDSYTWYIFHNNHIAKSICVW